VGRTGRPVLGRVGDELDPGAGGQLVLQPPRGQRAVGRVATGAAVVEEPALCRPLRGEVNAVHVLRVCAGGVNASAVRAEAISARNRGEHRRVLGVGHAFHQMVGAY